MLQPGYQIFPFQHLTPHSRLTPRILLRELKCKVAKSDQGYQENFEILWG